MLSLSKHERSTRPTPSGFARQQVTFFCFAKKKVTKEKATPVYRRCAVPCVARLVRRLRNSRYALKQSSPKSPDQPALLGGAQGMKSKVQNHRVGTAYPPYLAFDQHAMTKLANSALESMLGRESIRFRFYVPRSHCLGYQDFSGAFLPRTFSPTPSSC